VGAAAVWLLLPRDHEPVYQGKKLSNWVISLGLARFGMAPAEDQKDAILQIGTNALPFLVKWITYPAPPDPRLFGVPFRIPIAHTKADLAHGSLAAFSVLGPCAAPALPNLVCLVKETNEVVFNRVLGAIETVVRNLGTNGALVVPPLVQLLNSPDSQVAGIAAIELGNIGKRTQADAIVAALAQATESADKYVRYCSAYGLGELGSHAQPAVSALVCALGDPDLWVRQTATNSLNKVIPQILSMKKAEHSL
jgi:HEAT repeats